MNAKRMHDDNGLSNLLYKTISTAIVGLSFFTVAFLIWTNQKGFQITDEGFFLLSSQYPQEVKAWPNVAYIYTALMYNFVGQNIIWLRFFGEILLFASSFLFFYGAYRFVRMVYPEVNYSLSALAMMWSLINLGSLLFYVYFVSTPQYNLLNTIAIYAGTGLFCLNLTYLSSSTTKSIVPQIQLFGAGLFIGVSLFVKFPTAIVLSVLYSFVLLLWPRLKWTKRFQSVTMLVLGAGTWIAFHLIFLQPWPSLWNTIRNGIFAVTFITSGHSVSSLFRYLSESFELITDVFHSYWVCYVGLLVSLIFYFENFTHKRNALKIMCALMVMFFFMMAYKSFTLRLYEGGLYNFVNLMQFYTIWLLLLLSSVFITLIYQNKFVEHLRSDAGKKVLLVLILFLALPYAGAIGTGNLITVNLIIHLAPWLALIGFLLFSLTLAFNNRWIFLVGTLVVSAFACSQIISAGFFSPYINATILGPSAPTAIGYPPTYLQLNKETHEFFIQLKRVAENHGFKSGDDILAFSNMPGIVFALGGKSPVVPWYTDLPNAKKANEWFLEQTSRTRINKAFILQNPRSENGLPDLSKFGIQFPADYVLCGEVIWPATGEWIRLWKPKKQLS